MQSNKQVMIWNKLPEKKWSEENRPAVMTLEVKKHILIQHDLLAVAEIDKEVLSCLVLP